MEPLPVEIADAAEAETVESKRSSTVTRNERPGSDPGPFRWARPVRPRRSRRAPIDAAMSLCGLTARLEWNRQCWLVAADRLADALGRLTGQVVAATDGGAVGARPCARVPDGPALRM